MAMAARNICNEEGFPSSSFGDSAEKPPKTIRVDGERTVFPAHPSHRHNIIPSALDLQLLMVNYDQKGLLFEMPAHSISSAVNRLEKSLSQVLTKFYPLAGRLTSSSDGVISIDCNNAGAAFIEASAENFDVADVMTTEVIPTVYQMFPLNGAVNAEGCRLPVLAVQVTKLSDGIFVGCSANHVLIDGVSLWHFFNSWAEVCCGAQNISGDPIHDRSLLSLSLPPVRLNFDLDADFTRFTPPPLRAKMFHFSKDMVQGLKARANRDSPVSPVSSLQALCSHTWQAVMRARGILGPQPQDPTTFQQSVDCRSRVVPPLPSAYFGNGIQSVGVTTTVGELSSNDISFAAQVLRSGIHSHGDKSVRERIVGWTKNPRLVKLEDVVSAKNVLLLGSSPRFKMYETDFGWGRPVAARSGSGNKIDGKIHAYPGKDGDGSVDFEICLAPNVMDALEIDQQFLNPLLSYDAALHCYIARQFS